MPNVVLKVFMANENAIMPKYGTQFAACFDFHACLKGVETVTAFDTKNEKVEVAVETDDDGKSYIDLQPGYRYLVPTGLIFDIPNYLSMRAHPRSGLSVKHGIALVNCEGVIDPDYVEETKLTLFNVSEVPFRLFHGERAAQGEMVEVDNRVVQFYRIPRRPNQKGDRAGGFGSTGR